MRVGAFGHGFKRVNSGIKAAGRPVGRPFEKLLKLSEGIMVTWLGRVLESLTQQVLN